MASRNVDPLFVSRLEKPPDPPARKRTTGPRPQVRRWIALLVGGAAAVVLLCQFAAMAARPVLSIYRNGLEARRLEADLARLRARRDALRKQAGYLSTRQGIEEEARRQGWVSKGEVALQVIQPEGESEEKAADAGSEPPPDSTDTFWGRARQFLDTCWRGITGGPRR